MSINFYGLRQARGILRKTKVPHGLPGRRDAYAKGWRDAIREADRSILEVIEAEKSPRLKPESSP